MSTVWQLPATLCFIWLGTFMIYVWPRPSRSACLTVVFLAVGLRLAWIRWMGDLGSYWGEWWISWGAFLGLASLLVLPVQIALARGATESERKLLRQTFFAGAVFPVCGLLIAYTVPMTTKLRPTTYDAFLLAFDGSLGFQPSFLLGRILPFGSSYWGLTTVVYYALPLAVAVLYASHLAARRSSKRQPVAILALFLSLMVAGAVLYAIYPAIGPMLAFPEWYPKHPPLPAQVAIRAMTVPDDPRNCMPSLHFAGALAVWWNARVWPRWGRALAAWFLCATIFATLALGEHYLVDLVVAVPFTLALQAAWSLGIPFTDSARQRPLVAGTILVVAWLVLLRYGSRLFFVSPAMSWGLILLTLGWCLVLRKQLSDSTSKEALIKSLCG